MWIAICLDPMLQGFRPVLTQEVHPSRTNCVRGRMQVHCQIPRLDWIDSSNRANLWSHLHRRLGLNAACKCVTLDLVEGEHAMLHLVLSFSLPVSGRGLAWLGFLAHYITSCCLGTSICWRIRWGIVRNIEGLQHGACKHNSVGCLVCSSSNIIALRAS